MANRRSSHVIAVAVAVWVVAVSGGMLALLRYKSSPGLPAVAPRAWPAGSALARTAGLPTLIMMSHPRCPCTRASLSELNSLMSQFRGRLTAYILFIKPAGVPTDWTNTDLWLSAKRIPAVHTFIDEAGREAGRFDALTSGTVLLYDSEGRLEFSGGITGARGHIGDNLGLRRVMSLLRGDEADRTDSPVFGCPLHSPE